MSWERYKTTQTGIEIRSLTGGVIYPRSYCDDPDIGPVGIYIAKGPVCKLKLTPVKQFANTNIAWDISASGSSTGTVDSFDITWNGATNTGDLSAQDWSSDPKTGNVQFTTIGTYTVVATVTDLLGVTSEPCRVEVEIVTSERLYIGTSDAGVYTLAPGGTPAAANTGLTGGNLNLRSLRLHPAYIDLPLTQRHIWIATESGLAYSTNGASSWTTISKAALGAPENVAEDDPAPATADLDQIDLCFDPISPDVVYVLRTTATRAWLYYTEDYGVTWSNRQVSK